MCLFCDIVSGKVPSEKVMETENILAFKTIDPVAPVHILVIPKKHIASMDDLTPDDLEVAVGMVMAAKDVARQEGISDSGYRVVVNTGDDSGREIDHLHWHVIGGRKLKWEF